MNFKKYYINGNKFTFTITFRSESLWNNLMYKLTKLTTKKIKLKIKDVVILNLDLPNIKSGTIGTVFFIYLNHKKYEVKFKTEKGIFIETVLREQLSLKSSGVS